MLPHKYSLLMHPKSIWSADMNLEMIAPVEHILSLDPLDVCDSRAILVIFHLLKYQGLRSVMFLQTLLIAEY